MKKAPLHIAIPAPCTENFGAMKPAGAGRYCGSCDKIIYDFSQMTDVELIRFFEQKPETHCGRFHNSQLNRNIEPVSLRNNFHKKFLKIAASVLAIITLRSVPAKAQGVVNPNLLQNPLKIKTPLPAQQDILIKGTVLDDNNQPLQNATVKFDGIPETKTDQNGAYSFHLENIKESHNIYFSCPNFVTTVRTYNPVMGSTDFNVALGRRDSNAVIFSGYTGGVPIFYSDIFPSLHYSGQSIILSKDQKQILSSVASKMKSNPSATIRLVCYASAFTEFPSNPDWKRMKQIPQLPQKRANAVKHFLVNEMGIASERIEQLLDFEAEIKIPSQSELTNRK